MKDFLEKEIKINDTVIYIVNLPTGSSSSRKVMFKGKVVDFQIKKVMKKVVIERLYTNEEYFKIGVCDTVFPKDVCVIDA